jgi:hypothetical protein
MILQILKEVAEARLHEADPDTSIQLSLEFMNQAVKELREITGANIIVNEMGMTEFKMMVFDTEFTITNRSYRDDSNHTDVEQVIIKHLLYKQQDI